MRAQALYNGELQGFDLYILSHHEKSILRLLLLLEYRRSRLHLPQPKEGLARCHRYIPLFPL